MQESRKPHFKEKFFFISTRKKKKRATVKMLTQDGKLVEIG